MKHLRTALSLLLVMSILLLAPSCGMVKPKKDPVKALECTQPAAISAVYSAGNAQVVVIWADYENEKTTLQIVDIDDDTVKREVTIDSVWDLKEQQFSDGRLAMCQRDTNTWKFMSNSLEEIGTWSCENVDGFFSYDASSYYYLNDHVLYRKDVKSNEKSKVSLPIDLRVLEISNYNPKSGALVMQFMISPYSSECGTVIYNTKTGELTMLQKDRYNANFSGDDIFLLNFDNDKMGYSVLYGSGNEFHFAAADIFLNTVGELYTVSGSPYLMGISTDGSTLFATDGKISSCPLSGLGISGEMYTSCYLEEENLIVGAVYQDGKFRIYVMDPDQLTFTATADAADAESPMKVDTEVADAYWGAVAGEPVADSLKEARLYADKLEEKYSVRILLSSQCKEEAALSDRKITLTDTMSAEDELDGINTFLNALDRSLTLYPKNFLRQFRNSENEGGLCFLLVKGLESDFNAVGNAYSNADWNYISLDVRQRYALEGIICHEIWHATEDHILSCDYTMFPTDEWAKLNPDGFTYYENAADQNPEQPWTLFNDKPENVHFVDSYGCVNVKEDRARIMEYFITRDNEAKLLIQSPFIRKKLQIMCDAVRSCFDTTGWEDVPWERLLK